jgi:hypothetical protein
VGLPIEYINYDGVICKHEMQEEEEEGEETEEEEEEEETEEEEEEEEVCIILRMLIPEGTCASILPYHWPRKLGL